MDRSDTTRHAGPAQANARPSCFFGRVVLLFFFPMPTLLFPAGFVLNPLHCMRVTCRFASTPACPACTLADCGSFFSHRVRVIIDEYLLSGFFSTIACLPVGPATHRGSVATTGEERGVEPGGQPARDVRQRQIGLDLVSCRLCSCLRRIRQVVFGYGVLLVANTFALSSYSRAAYA